MRKILTVGMAFLLMGVHNMNAQEITDMGHATIIFSQKGEIILEERNDATAIRKQSAGNAEEGLYDKGTSSFFNICWFTYQYPSTSGDGQEIMLSALACMPDNNEATINNVLVGCHATIAANRQCPSRFNQTGSNFSDVFLTMTLAGNTGQGQGDMAYNNLVILPDYPLGGKEYLGYTLQSDKNLFLGHTPTKEEEQSRSEFVAHEITQLWFGGLVALKNPNETWAKEVIANYIASKVTHNKLPDADYNDART